MDTSEFSATVRELRAQAAELKDKFLRTTIESRLGSLERAFGEFITASHPAARAMTIEQLLSMSESARSEIFMAAAAQKRKEAEGEEVRKRGAAVDQWPEGYQPTAHDMLRMSFREDDNQLQQSYKSARRIGG